MTMTTEQISAMLTETGFPVAYYQFDESTALPPFICFFYPSQRNFNAGGGAYVRITRLQIELYTDSKDFEREAEVERVLARRGLTWRKEEVYIDEEQMFLTAYEMEVLIDEEQSEI